MLCSYSIHSGIHVRDVSRVASGDYAEKVAKTSDLVLFANTAHEGLTTTKPVHVIIGRMHIDRTDPNLAPRYDYSSSRPRRDSQVFLTQ